MKGKYFNFLLIVKSIKSQTLIIILQPVELLKKYFIMNKLLGLIIFSIALLAKTNSLNAQTPEPAFLNSDRGLQRAEILKLEMKDDLKIYDKKFDSLYAIQRDFLIKVKQIRFDKKLTEDLKQKKEKELVDARRRRLKAAGLDDAEIKRVEDYFAAKEKQARR